MTKLTHNRFTKRSSTAILIGLVVYLVVAVSIACMYYIVPTSVLLYLAFLLYFPHILALINIRKPQPWHHRKHEELVLLYAAYGTIPMACLAIIVLLALSSWSAGFSDLGLLPVALTFSILFTVLSVGTSFIAGGALARRQKFYESHCSKCLYDISTIEADTCPECNAPITRPEEAST